jgi:hypothetical protein
METKKIAGIQFTNTGVLIEKSYQKDDELCVKQQLSEELFTGDFLKIAKLLAKLRMSKCFKKLHQNLSQASHITEHIIAWKGGHFSVSVWEQLEAILSITDVRQLNRLQAQQLIRAIMLDEAGYWFSDFDENWNSNEKSECRLTPEFKRFITEHILVTE